MPDERGDAKKPNVKLPGAVGPRDVMRIVGGLLILTPIVVLIPMVGTSVANLFSND